MEQSETNGSRLDQRLEKIRSSPDLQNQQQSRAVLLAVEDTLREQNSPITPTAYFAALLSLLAQHGENSDRNSDVTLAVVYLLDIITPHVPKPLLRSKFVPILNSLTPALSEDGADGPLLRASIGTLVSLLNAQDPQAWTLPPTQAGPRQALAGLLKLAVDHRPKVRKRAQDGIKSVLSHDLPSPSLDHPAADMCAETALKTFETVVDQDSSHKQHTQGHTREPMLIHAMQLIKTVAKAAGGWPSQGLESLTKTLFVVARSRSEHLTTTAFEIFETIFESMANEENFEKLPHLLDAMLEIQPSEKDSQLLPPWIAVISRGFDVSSQVDDVETFQQLPDIFRRISNFLASPTQNIRVSASECLISFLVNCVPASVILEPSIMDEKVLEKVANNVNELFDVKFQAAWLEVFSVLEATLENFRWQSVPLLNKAVQTIGELRTSEMFQNKDRADEVIAKAIQCMGPEAVLKILPLNLGAPSGKRQGRAWLIPIIRDNVSNTKLQHFKTELTPLSESLFQKVLDAGQQKTMESKVFETLVQQIWSCLPGYCDRPADLPAAFDQKFAEMISNLLYRQPEMRNDLCHALQNLVDGYKIITAGTDSEEDLVTHNRLTKSAAQDSLNHLSSFAANLLAILFNIYGETLPQHRSPILNSINAYLSITSSSDLSQTLERVASTFETAFTEQAAKAATGKESKKHKSPLPPMTHALMDIIVAIAVYLPRESYQRLFTIASTLLNQKHEPALQKKAYKLIPRLAQSELGKQAIFERSSELQQMLLTNTDNTLVPARKDRLSALTETVKTLPDSDLSFIPNILPEVILRTKETNERARESAFALIVAMGERMRQGGTIDNGRVANAAPDTPSAQASVEEYLTILSAGLAGSTPHMISASVTAISRAVFAFHKELSDKTLSELLDTMSLFLESPTREVVRSVLGFVKVSVIMLPQKLMETRLPELIPRLVRWSHEHKNSFKAKVKNILERVIRRFGIQVVERHCPEEDRKLVANIRKTRERRKKKRSGKDAEDGEEGELDGEDGEQQRAGFSNAFDKAIYGSDEESEGSEEDAVAHNGSQQRGKPHTGKPQGEKAGNAYIHEDEDEPLDLLDKRALANISSTRPLQARTAPKKHGAQSKTDVDGKLVFRDNDEDEDEEMVELDRNAESGSLEKGIDAYVEAIRGKHAAQRGQKGRLKMKAARARDEDVEMGDGGQKSGRGEIKSPKMKHKRMGSDGGNARGGRVGKRGRGGFGGWKSPKAR